MFVPGERVAWDALDDTERSLLRAAEGARAHSYCPYSKFAVGAAIRTHGSLVFTGCNVESCSYTPTVCAERTAVAKAVSEGHRRVLAVAVVAPAIAAGPTSPCGVCRQFIREFADDDALVLLAPPEMNEAHRVRLGELLPMAFHMRTDSS